MCVCRYACRDEGVVPFLAETSQGEGVVKDLSLKPGEPQLVRKGGVDVDRLLA